MFKKLAAAEPTTLLTWLLGAGMTGFGLGALLAPAGLNVEQDGSVSQPFLSVQGTTLKVQGADVQVFEYEDAEAAKVDMAKIGPDGNPPTMMIEWVAPPHFYQQGSSSSCISAVTLKLRRH